MNQDSLAVYLEQDLGSTLRRGDVVMLDNLPIHKVASMREIRAC